jgi:hypothetical protein
MTALATPAQLAAYIQQSLSDTDASALLMLSIASGMVRDYLQQQLSLLVGDVLITDLVNNEVFLPEFPVTAVSLVETFDGTVWTTADIKTYTVSKRLGIISTIPYSGVIWPTKPETWRVTYSHGFAAIPDALVGVCLGVAARAYASPAGVDSERIGGYQVKYGMESEGFSAIEKKAMGRYLNPRIS